MIYSQQSRAVVFVCNTAAALALKETTNHSNITYTVYCSTIWLQVLQRAMQWLPVLLTCTINIRGNWCGVSMISSVTRTPLNSVVVQRRSKSKSYRQSYRSCLGAASRLGFTPALTGRRLNTSRRATKSHDITVSPCRPLFLSVISWNIYNPRLHFHFWSVKHRIFISILSSPLFVKAESEPRAAGLTDENRVAAVLCYPSLPVQTHPAEELRQAALSVYCCREAARFGCGGGGTAEQLQSLLLCGAGDGRDRWWCRDCLYTGKHGIL